jgi:hypothetical protein
MDKTSENVIIVLGFATGVLATTVVVQNVRLAKLYKVASQLKTYNSLTIRLLHEQPALVISSKLKNDFDAFNMFVDNDLY